MPNFRLYRQIEKKRHLLIWFNGRCVFLVLLLWPLKCMGGQLAGQARKHTDTARASMCVHRWARCFVFSLCTRQIHACILCNIIEQRIITKKWQSAQAPRDEYLALRTCGQQQLLGCRIQHAPTSRMHVIMCLLCLSRAPGYICKHPNPPPLPLVLTLLLERISVPKYQHNLL